MYLYKNASVNVYKKTGLIVSKSIEQLLIATRNQSLANIFSPPSGTKCVGRNFKNSPHDAVVSNGQIYCRVPVNKKALK